MKTIILKPVMWNTKKYMKPSGYPSTGGFAKDNGYGHEEWNNNPRRIWQGQKVFHTESGSKLFGYSKTAELGVIQIVSLKGEQYAVAIATSVVNNTDSQCEAVAKDLSLYEDWKEVWSVPAVKRCFKHNKLKFLDHWQGAYKWVRLRCPPEEYFHFVRPLPLDPVLISGMSRLISMHGSYQAIYPDQALQIVADVLPEDHPICNWLRVGDFDETFISKRVRDFYVSHQGLAVQKKGSSNAPAAKAYEYLVEGKRHVEPLHAELQKRFVRHLDANNITNKPNRSYVDVEYQLNDKTVLVEIKPITDKILTRYAIRMAVGQLLEYRYKRSNDDLLEIVLGKKPSNQEKTRQVLGNPIDLLRHFERHIHTGIST